MKRLFVLFILSFTLAFAPAGRGGVAGFQRLVVFGDSLSDTGNTFATVGLPKPPYYNGRWTNGPNWVDYFVPLAGFPWPMAYLRHGGTNFAVGGATSEYALGEVGSYLAVAGGRASPDNLYVLWIGANDFRAGLNAQQTLNYVQTEVVNLAVAGARSLLLILVPDISLTPSVRAAGGATISAAQEFVATVNAGLTSRVPWLATVLGMQITPVDINPLFTDLVNEPAAYGFANSIGAAYDPNTGALAPDPNLFVFWDGFHPTTRVHQLAAQVIFNALNAQAAPAPLLTFGSP